MLLASAFALEGHAARGDQVAPGEPFEFTGTGPIHVVGIVEPGSDARESASCTVASAARMETVEVRTRQDAFEAIRVGHRLHALDGEPTTVACDRRVAIAGGWAVRAYPLAGAAILYPSYAMVAMLGFSYARRRSRSPAMAGTPVRPGDDADRASLKRFAAETVLGAVSVAAGYAAIVLGIVGLLVLREGSPAALAILVLAGFLGVAAFLVRRWRRARSTDRDLPPAT